MQGGENKSESELERQVDDLMELGRDQPMVNALRPKAVELVPPTDKASLDDKLTEKAIDDITRSESDELQSFEDNEDNLPLDPTVEVKDHPHRKLKITIWSIVLVLIALGVAYLVPTSRFWAFNLVGLRASASLLVVDSSNSKPINGAKIKVGGATFTTNKDGRANLSNVKLGAGDLNVSRLAYASLTRKVTIIPGNNQLGKVSLQPVVVDYKINIKNALSLQPLVGVELDYLTQTTKSDISGQAVLPLKGQQADKLEVKLTKAGFNDKIIIISASDTKADNVRLVPQGHDYYIGTVGGAQGVVSVNLDGSDPKLAFSAAQADVSINNLIVSPSGQFIAVIGASGSGSESLIIINTATGNYQFLARGDGVRLYGWLGSSVVYATGSKCSLDMCYRLNMTDVSNGSGWEPSGFVGPDTVVLVGDEVVYATSQNQDGSAPAAYLTSAGGASVHKITSDPVSKIERVSDIDVLISASSKQLLYDVADRVFVVNIDLVDTKSNRQFIDGGNLAAAWVSQKGGQSNLMIGGGVGPDKLAFSSSNQLTPRRFVGNDYLIFEQKSDSGSSDYIYSTTSGKVLKIVDLPD